MKKILLVMSVAMLIALCSAPSFVKAEIYNVGTAIVTKNGVTFQADLFCDEYPQSLNTTYISSKYWINSQSRYSLTWSYNGQTSICYVHEVNYMYIPTLGANTVIERGPSSDPTLYKTYAYNNESDYNNNIPEEFRPVEPSLSEQRWLDFYDWFYEKFGYYPREGSLIDLIRLLAIGDWTDREEVEITYPTLTPVPPSPTPIPVQQIFVPDGNGNTTIIYQYTDPTTGVITQSPYNPNIDIDMNCNCDGDSGDNTFVHDPTDPTALTSSMLWADGFGVEISDNPLTAANDSQKSLAEAAAEYSDSVNVVSNSFNVLPFKWLVLVGLLGGILIIAGLIRTFLGG